MGPSAILIGIETAANLLSVPPRRLARLVKEGRVPIVDLGDGVPRFAPDELRAWALSQSRPQETAQAAR
jgi:hypothetical protein